LVEEYVKIVAKEFNKHVEELMESQYW